jgi:hypothetical protein
MHEPPAKMKKKIIEKMAKRFVTKYFGIPNKFFCDNVMMYVVR